MLSVIRLTRKKRDRDGNIKREAAEVKQEEDDLCKRTVRKDRRTYLD